MNTATRVMIYCPLCEGKLLAQKAIVEGTKIPCPLCSREFRFSSMKNHRSEPLVIPFVDDNSAESPAVATKPYLQNAELLKNTVIAQKLAFESGSKIVLPTPLKPIPAPVLDSTISVAALAQPASTPVALTTGLMSATPPIVPFKTPVSVSAAVELTPSLELEPEIAQKTGTSAPIAKSSIDRRVIPVKPIATPKQSAPKNMAAQFFLAATPEKEPTSKVPYIVGGIMALITLIFLGIVLYPIARAKYWPLEMDDTVVAESDPNAGTEVSPYTEQVVRPYKPSVAPPLEPNPADGEERRAKLESAVMKRQDAFQQQQEEKAARDLKKAQDDEAKRLDDEKRKQRADELKKFEEDRLEKVRLDDLVKQTFQRKVLINKVKSATTFMHDDGQGKYDIAMREMNSAQEDYAYQNRAAPSRAKSTLLSHAVDGINVAFKHGLEAYDYMIKKKVLQLDAALEIDPEGMPQADKDRVKAMREEGRWLTHPGALIWWLGGSFHPRGANWYHDATLVTVKDLYAQDRSAEVAGKQKRVDEKFNK